MKLFVLTLFLACFATTFGENQLNLEGYVFIHFTGNTFEGENIYIAASQGNDALNYTDLNGGKPILFSKYGTKGLRDPFIIRSHEGDKFYLLATDLSIASLDQDWAQSSRFGSRYLEIWESTDLINWSEQRHVLITAPLNVGCTWAPEAHYDKTLGKYVVYWSSTLYKDDDTNHDGPSYHRQIYATTEDFVTFSEPQVWQDDGDRIDTTVFEEDGTFYRFLVGDADGCHDIIRETSTNLTELTQGWHLDLTCLSKKIQSKYIEGPTCFKSNPGDVRGDKYYLFVDEESQRGYVPLETDDIKNGAWKISESYKMPTRSRHGTVFPVTAEELARITSALG